MRESEEGRIFSVNIPGGGKTKKPLCYYRANEASSHFGEM